MSNVKIEQLEKAVAELQTQLADAQDDIENLHQQLAKSKPAAKPKKK